MIARTTRIFCDDGTTVKLRSGYVCCVNGVVSQSTVGAVHENLVYCAYGCQIGRCVGVDCDCCDVCRKVAVGGGRAGESDRRVIDVEATVRSGNGGIFDRGAS